MKIKFESLYYFMSGSSIRTTQLKKLQEILVELDLTIKEPHSIRWLGLRNAVLAVYESYGALLVTLSSFAAEGNPQAKGLLKYFSQYKTVILVAFVLDVHEVLAILSSQLQKKNFVFNEYQPLIDATYAKLEFLGKNEGAAVNAMRKCIEIRVEDDKNHAYLSGEKLSHYSENTEMHVNNERKEYISHLKKNLKHRFRKEESEMINDLGLILEPSVMQRSNNEEVENATECVSSFYDSDKTCQIVHGNLVEGVTEEEETFDKLLD